MSVSVVVCAYTQDRWPLIQEAVRSILDQVRGADEVLVVIDHCPGLEGLCRAHFTDPRVRVLVNSNRRGLSGARNVGVAASRGDIVVFLDDDARALPGWLDAHARHYTQANVLGVGGTVLPDWEGGAPSWFPPEFGWVVGCSYVGLPTVTTPVRNPIGANMSFRREVLDAVGGFSESLGRVGLTPVGCEETEVSIRAAKAFPQGRILFEPEAMVRHWVPRSRRSWSYFAHRCWSEGLSKAVVSRLADPATALASETHYVTRTLPRGVGRDLDLAARQRRAVFLARALAIVGGVAVTTAGYVAGQLLDEDTKTTGKKELMGTLETSSNEWLHFDVHQRVGIKIAANSPAAPQLRMMLDCFRSDSAVPADITVAADPENVADPSDLENDLRYTAGSVEFVREGVQIVREDGRFRIHGHGELLTSLVPVLDRAMVERGAAMIHAATVAYRGQAIALPAAGGTGKTSTVAKLMRKEGYSFMGDDWAFLSDDMRLLGYEKPMFIKPHHRPIYPHMFQGVRKPMVPVSLSRPVGRLTTVVHPTIIKYPRLADVVRRWSPEHRMVNAAQALPGVPVTRVAPLVLAVYVERYGGENTDLSEVSESWMVDRMIGNFHVELAGFSQEVVTGMAAASMLPWREFVEDKGDVLSKAVTGVPCYLLKVPRHFSPDQASDEVVGVLDQLVPALVGAPDEPA